MGDSILIGNVMSLSWGDLNALDLQMEEIESLPEVKE